MIVRPKESWFRLLFVWHGSVLKSILPQLLVIWVLSTLAVVTHGRILGEKIPLSTTLLTLFGLTLAIFLGFRNTVSYERFKEARALWGIMLIASRSLTSQLLCYLPEPKDATGLADLLVATTYLLKHELRGTDPRADVGRLLGDEQADVLCRKGYGAAAAIHALRERVSAFNRQGLVPDAHLWMIDAQINELSKAVGGCERLASTPIPFAYSVLLHRTVYTYCMLLPFGLVDSAEFLTPLLCVFLSYTLIALEAIAEEVAEPFSLAPHALALDAMARNIERSVFEYCARALPDALLPDARCQLT